MNINTNMNHDKKWFVYKPIPNKFPQVEEHPCTFEEALAKAWELQKMIDANDKRSQR
jgi:3-methyladenine DNA glycosylase AlkC